MAKKSHKALLAGWENLPPFGFYLYFLILALELASGLWVRPIISHTLLMLWAPLTNTHNAQAVAEDGRRAEDQVKSATSCARLPSGAHTKDPQTRCRRCRSRCRCLCPLRLRFGHAGRAEELGKAKLVSRRAHSLARSGLKAKAKAKPKPKPCACVQSTSTAIRA